MSNTNSRPEVLVVISLGYVGLPLALGALRAGLTVTGLEISDSIVASLSDRRSHVDEIEDSEIAWMRSAGFRAISDPPCLGATDIVVICVPTPFSSDCGPNLDAVKPAGGALAAHLKAVQLVVLESTTYSGTTEEVLVPLLEATGLQVGKDFNCAFSPERIDPGNSTCTLVNNPKVVGEISPECTAREAAFYDSKVDEVVVAKGAREAGMTELLENTYWHVNIALVNEIARFCTELGTDLWDSIRCVSTNPFGFRAFYRGPGVGGHCKPINPNYLSHRVKTNLGYSLRFVELVQEVNVGMPAYVAQRVQDRLNEQGKAAKGSRVLLLGVTQQCVEDLEAELGSADAVVLLHAHAHYAQAKFAALGAPIRDTRGVLDGPRVTRL